MKADSASQYGIFIALGSNLGDREGYLRSALAALGSLADIRVLRCSSFHETEAVGGPSGQGRYLNAVAEIETALPPQALLARLHEIERSHGRIRTQPNAPRTLDLDLLLYRDEQLDDANLCVPHPRMWDRAFVMLPLREICPAATLAELRQRFAARSSACTST